MCVNHFGIVSLPAVGLFVIVADKDKRTDVLLILTGLALLSVIYDIGDFIWIAPAMLARSLVELRDTALELDGLDLYACAASVETMSRTPADVGERLAGVMSTPRFLREVQGAALIFV